VLIGQVCRAPKNYAKGFGFEANADRGCKVLRGLLEGLGSRPEGAPRVRWKGVRGFQPIW